MDLNTDYLLNNRYKILSVLGRGGFGITYKAFDLALSRTVAVKEFYYAQICQRTNNDPALIVTGDRALFDKLLKRFITEAERLANLRHAGLVTVYDRFEQNNTAYFVMEYVAGLTLEEKVKASGKFDTKEAIEIVLQLTETLKYLHSEQVSHFDVKPSNVLITNTNQIFLIDFGISKKFVEGADENTVIATVSKGYAPLEQYSQEGTWLFSPCIDIYALGATLFYIIAAQRPPEATQIDLIRTIKNQNISAELIAIISQAMQRDPKDRFQTMDEFAAALKTVEVKAAPNPNHETKSKSISKPEPQPPSTRNPLKAIVWGLGFSALFSLFGYYFYTDISVLLLSTILQKSIWVPSAIKEIFNLGLILLSLSFCISFEFIPNSHKKKLFFSFFFIASVLLLLTLLWLIPYTGKQLVKMWFFMAFAFFPLLLFAVRYIVFELIFRYSFVEDN